MLARAAESACSSRTAATTERKRRLYSVVGIMITSRAAAQARSSAEEHETMGSQLGRISLDGTHLHTQQLATLHVLALDAPWFSQLAAATREVVSQRTTATSDSPRTSMTVASLSSRGGMSLSLV